EKGGVLCFFLLARVSMPYEGFRFGISRGSTSRSENIDSYYQFSYGTLQHPLSWVDVCFDIPTGQHELEWALAWPGFFDPQYDNIPGYREMVEESRVERKKEPEHYPSGEVLLDNVRFFPWPYDDFETGDFSRQKWKIYGDGSPWVISETNAAFEGRYAAHARPTLDTPRGTSKLELALDT
ncbi:MAG: hypothetical protein ACPH86_06420, partial [Schleiferiaceae bacterium]